MTYSHQFKPTHKEIKRYYEELAGYVTHEVVHEGATSSAFQNLLAATCKKAGWHLVPQLATKIRGKAVRPDGILRDEFNLHRGYWEAKDSSDKLDVEIRKKIAGLPVLVRELIAHLDTSALTRILTNTCFSIKDGSYVTIKFH